MLTQQYTTDRITYGRGGDVVSKPSGAGWMSGTCDWRRHIPLETANCADAVKRFPRAFYASWWTSGALEKGSAGLPALVLFFSDKVLMSLKQWLKTKGPKKKCTRQKSS
jgi:hypothetical protein